jgi:long-chain acyl-CoA synthetase
VQKPDHVLGPLVFEPLLFGAAAHPDRGAIADDKRQLTYRELADAVERQATVLREQGIAPGERVALAARNSVDQVVAHFAILRAGAVSVPLAGATPPNRLGFIVRDCDARMICVDQVTETAAVEAAGDGCKRMTLEELSRSAGLAAPLAEPASRSRDDIACLMYTTGSTGDPKAVMLSHRNLCNALSHIIEYLGCDETDREAVVLPLSHSFALGHAYCTLFTGGFVWVNDGLRPLKTVLDAMPRYGINAMPTTPAMLRLLLGPYRVPFLRSAAGLRRMVVNSEPLPPDQADELLAALPATDVVVYYGLTEASRSSFLRLRKEPRERYGSVGRAAPRVAIEVHGDDEAPVPPGVEGEVCISGPHLAVGYWRRPEDQAATFRSGWLHTGDLGTLDADGYLTITGRLKDQINVGGLKVSAAEVEAAIRKHPMVADVAVTGIPDRDGLRGEAIAAVIVAANPSLSAAEIAATCAAHLEPAAQPQHILLVDAIPRAESGKILKGELRRLFEVGHAGADA